MGYKKGFTLVEMLAVLAIMSLILIIAVPQIISIGNNMNQRMYDQKIRMIERAAEKFGKDNSGRIKRIIGIACTSNVTDKCECIDGKCYYIYDVTVGELVDEGFYKAEKGSTTCKVLDPRDLSCMDNYVVRLKINGRTVIAKFDKSRISTSSNEIVIKLDKGNYASSIAKNELKCTPTGSDTTCNVLFPTITASSEFNVLGWSQDKDDTTAEVAAGASLTVSKRDKGKTYYAILKDIQKPVCTFTDVPSSAAIGKKTITLTCKDNGSGFANDQMISQSDITSSSTSVAEITNITPIKNTTNEKSYQIEITTKTSGASNFTIKENALKDKDGNGNDLLKSSNMIVSEYSFDYVERWEIGKIVRSDVIAYLYKNADIKGVDDGHYTLKIVGIGDMLDFDTLSSKSAPWASKYKKEITDVQIESGVTNVGKAAFYDHSILSNIKLSKDTTVIESYAFYKCSVLDNVTIPALVTSIGEYSFNNDVGLKTLTFENNSKTKVINNKAFYRCDIQNLTIPASVENIDQYAFYENKNLKTLNFENNSMLKTIGDYAFTDSSITTLNLPSTLEKIGKYSFFKSRIKLECPFTLKDISFASNSKLKIIGEDAFYCSGVRTLTFPNMLETIDKSAFQSSDLRSVTFPASLITIGAGAFLGNSSLTNVTFVGTPTLKTIGASSFGGTALTSFTIPNSVEEIGGHAFGDSNLNSITIPNSVKSIGPGAFNNTNIRTLNLPASVNTIQNAIIHTSNLSSITVDSNSPYFSAENGVLYDKNKTRLINVPDTYGHSHSLLNIPDTVVSSDSKAFDGWMWNGSSFMVDLPKGLTNITIGEFSVSSISIEGEFTNTTDNSVYAVQDGILFSKDLKLLIRCGPLLSKTNYTIPNTTTEIKNSAFRDNVDVQTVTVPNSVTKIGSNAFHSYVDEGGIKTVNLYTNDDVSFEAGSFYPMWWGSNEYYISRNINVKTNTLKSNLESKLISDEYVGYNIKVVS